MGRKYVVKPPLSVPKARPFSQRGVLQISVLNALHPWCELVAYFAKSIQNEIVVFLNLAQTHARFLLLPGSDFFQHGTSRKGNHRIFGGQSLFEKLVLEFCGGF